MHKIGVFDSGIGGLSVVKAIEKAMPSSTVIFEYDSKHFPYANKPPEEILGFVEPIIQNLVKQGCEVIVVACNTVSTTLIGPLRERISIPLVAMEPMVKPAAELSKSKVIAVCATPTTLASKRYAELKEEYAQDVKVLEPDCSDWSYMIEHEQIDQEKISKSTNEVCNAGADVIVLGCTHYHWIEGLIEEMANGRAQVLQPEQAIIAQLNKVLL